MATAVKVICRFSLICTDASSFSLIFPSVFGLVITSSFSLNMVSSLWFSLSLSIPAFPTNCFLSSHHCLPLPTSPGLHLSLADGEAAFW